VSPYRQRGIPSGGLAAVRARIAEREAEVTEHFWRALPEGDRQDIDELRKGATDRNEDIAAESCFRLLAAIEAAIERLASIEEAWRTAPPDPPSGAVELRLVAPADLRRGLALVRKLDPKARATKGQGDEDDVRRVRAIVRFTHAEAPLCFQLWAPDQATDVVEMATSVAPGLPPVRVELAGAFDDLLASLGLGRDVEIGDDEMDALFEIRGDSESARALIGPPVRSALRMLAGIGAPWLETGKGHAIIGCKGTCPTAKQLERVANALVWLRTCHASLPLRAGAAPTKRKKLFQ
jgi:hypothetical protein